MVMHRGTSTCLTEPRTRGDKLHEMPPREAASSAGTSGWCFSTVNLFPLHRADNIIEAPIQVKASRRPRDRRGKDLLEQVGLAEKATPIRPSCPVVSSSACDRAGSCDGPKLMLFDEPTVALDPELVARSSPLMKKLARRRHDDGGGHPRDGLRREVADQSSSWTAGIVESGKHARC